MAGTQSGQVVVWDKKMGKIPTMKTPLTAKSHTQPVYALAQVGDENGHDLISASTDGALGGHCIGGPMQSLQSRAIPPVQSSSLDFSHSSSPVVKQCTRVLRK